MPAARRKRRQTKRKETKIDLTKGQLNRIIDVVLHRHFHRNPDLILLDGLAHAVVEDDLKRSLQRFVKYGVPALLKETERKRRRKRRRRGEATG